MVSESFKDGSPDKEEQRRKLKKNFLGEKDDKK